MNMKFLKNKIADLNIFEREALESVINNGAFHGLGELQNLMYKKLIAIKDPTGALYAPANVKKAYYELYPMSINK